MPESRTETDRAGALEILTSVGAGKVEAETALELADRDGRTSLRPGLALVSVVAGTEENEYVVFVKE